MQSSYFTIFVKDTSVLMVIAYLLTRGSLLRLMFRDRLRPIESLLLGSTLGLVVLGVSLLPEIGFQYAANTLFAAFTTLVGGLYVGLIAAVIGSVITIFQTPHRVVETLFGVLISWVLAARLRRQDTIPMRLLIGMVAGLLAQSARIMLHDAFAHVWKLRPLSSVAFFSIPLNGFGVALLLLIVSDAQVRADSENRRIEAERQRAKAEQAHALASEAQLAALRARIHPHFLFNALNSIAELCCIAPQRAETACLNLSHLMRRALETSALTVVPLREELALTHAYLQIEQERLGEHLCIVWQIDPGSEETQIVPFSVQVLVENAINHGLGPKIGGGSVTISVRRSSERTVIAVWDDGVGMPLEAHPKRQPEEEHPGHGLQILNRQLVLRCGDNARLRFFSRKEQGTLVAFALPDAQAPIGKEE